MGKRSDFKRVARDAYDTPLSAVLPLLPHLPGRVRFIEPCAGRGELVRHLERFGHTALRQYDYPERDARTAVYLKQNGPYEISCCFITNPPWTRTVLHDIIVNLSNQAPTWLLMDADWVHTVQAIPYLPRLRTIVSVGRVKWIPDSEFTGKDNAAWHLFTRPHDEATIFIGRRGVEELESWPKKISSPLRAGSSALSASMT